MTGELGTVDPFRFEREGAGNGIAELWFETGEID
jgi:hypothetical protein